MQEDRLTLIKLIKNSFVLSRKSQLHYTHFSGLCLCMCVCKREEDRDRETERQIDRQRDTEKDRDANKLKP